MTRAMICDPDMPNKACDGRIDDIRACVGCNQACIGHMQLGYPISCIQHPESGREITYGRYKDVEKPRRVLVAGGGPAGMKAAAVLRLNEATTSRCTNNPTSSEARYCLPSSCRGQGRQEYQGHG